MLGNHANLRRRYCGVRDVCARSKANFSAQIACVIHPFRTLSKVKGAQIARAVAARRMRKWWASFCGEKAKFIFLSTLFPLLNTHRLHYIAVESHTHFSRAVKITAHATSLIDRV
jgi:hypothetical protein